MKPAIRAIRASAAKDNYRMHVDNYGYCSERTFHDEKDTAK